MQSGAVRSSWLWAGADKGYPVVMEKHGKKGQAIPLSVAAEGSRRPYSLAIQAAVGWAFPPFQATPGARYQGKEPLRKDLFHAGEDEFQHGVGQQGRGLGHARGQGRIFEDVGLEVAHQHQIAQHALLHGLAAKAAHA